MADWSRTVHGIGDLHAGAMPRKRFQTLLDDLATLPTPVLHLQIGDATEHGTKGEDVIARRWLGKLPGPHETILGNHDIMHNERTPADWAKAYGYRSQNFTVDLPFVRIIAIAPGRDLPGRQAGVLSPATLAFLDRELRSAPGDCWIACHWPLYRTVLGDSKKVFNSTMPSFYAKPDAGIRSVLARHRKAKAWISGHTHSPIEVRGLVTRARVAEERSILAINLSAIVAVGKHRNAGDPIRSLYLTHLPGKIEIRFRDHRRRAWVAPHERRVVTVEV